ncbi:MAG: F0F1 ATP synthase subunit B [Planctomycetia bacterium]|nr:MAG: F0F1 ATP synthase subunit B [Planctomycetia bacterium]
MTPRTHAALIAAAAALGGALPALAAPAADGHAPGIFEGGLGNAIVQMIIFGAVVLILGRTAWPMIIRTLNEREKSIRESIESAHRRNDEAAALLKKHQELIDKARADATAIVEEGRRDGEDTRRRMADEARREADETVARAKREIELATQAAVKELYDRTAELSVQIAGGIVGKALSPDDHRALVAQSIERMTAARRAGSN